MKSTHGARGLSGKTYCGITIDNATMVKRGKDPTCAVCYRRVNDGENMSPIRTKGAENRKPMSKDELREFVLAVIKEKLEIEVECRELGEIQVRLILDGELLCAKYDYLTARKLEGA